MAAAHAMLCASLDWRFKFFGPRCGRDAAASMDVNELREQMASGKMHVSTARSLLGHPIVINTKSTEKATNHTGGIRMVVYCMERAALAAEEAGVDKWVWIIDLARYTRANSPPLAITRATLDIMQHHYPERLFKCFLVDAPRIFRWSWRLLRGIVDQVTRDKIEFVTNGATHAGLASFLKVISSENLLDRFGGTRPDVYDFSQEEEFLAQVVLQPTPDASVLPTRLASKDPTAANPSAADTSSAAADATAAGSAATPSDSVQPRVTRNSSRA